VASSELDKLRRWHQLRVALSNPTSGRDSPSSHTVDGDSDLPAPRGHRDVDSLVFETGGDAYFNDARTRLRRTVRLENFKTATMARTVPDLIQSKGRSNTGPSVRRSALKKKRKPSHPVIDIATPARPRKRARRETAAFPISDMPEALEQKTGSSRDTMGLFRLLRTACERLWQYPIDGRFSRRASLRGAGVRMSITG